jgi:hypothetical protein
LLNIVGSININAIIGIIIEFLDVPSKKVQYGIKKTTNPNTIYKGLGLY